MASQALSSASRRVTVIRAGAGAPSLATDLAELYAFRDLFATLVWRILAVRYKQTAVGSAWAVLQPFCLMVVFTLFFGRLTRISSGGIPYPLFYFTGLWVWQFVSQSVQQGSLSVGLNSHIVSKVYFPRALLPAANLAASFVDMVVALPALAAIMVLYGVAPNPLGLLAFLAVLVIAVAMALGLALFFSALYVLYRDTAYLLPFIVQVWMFASPVIYPISVVPAQYQNLYALNPMVALVQTTRWAFAGGAPTAPLLIAISAAAALLTLAAGYRFFRNRETLFTDLA